MSRCINKAILIGRLGADPEVRFTSSGIAVVNVSLATNESYTNREGEKVDKTEWHRLVFWRQLAEIAGQYLRKGASIYVEGRCATARGPTTEGTSASPVRSRSRSCPCWTVDAMDSTATCLTRRSWRPPPSNATACGGRQVTR